MYWHGVILAIASFLSIGVFHPIVIACEYHFSCRCWPVFFAAGTILLVLSTRTPDVIVSAILGVVGCSCMWSILELHQQRARVERGWFKANPKHHKIASRPLVQNAAYDLTDNTGNSITDNVANSAEGMTESVAADSAAVTTESGTADGYSLQRQGRWL